MDAIRKVLLDGIPEGDLVSYVAAAGELVRRHREDARWWSPANLFGVKTLDVWRAKIEEMEVADLRRAATLDELAAREAEHQRIVDAAPTPQVQSLALERLAREAAAAWRGRWDTGADDAEAAEEA